MRACRAGDGKSVCSGGGGVRDSSGEISGEADSCGTAEEVGVGDSCENTAEANSVMRIAVAVFVVMSSDGRGISSVKNRGRK